MPAKRNRKTAQARLSIVLILLCATGYTLFAQDAPECSQALPPEHRNDELVIATWNVRFLSNGSRDDAELAVIAGIMSQFDLIAVQELRDAEVMQRLLAFLPGYHALISNRTGRGQYERYAYVYRTGSVEPLGDTYLVADPADTFIREPFVAHFRAGNFDLTLITVHVLYGESVTARRAEISRLDDVMKAVNAANGAENDVILLGDFNVSSADPAWEMAGVLPLVPAVCPTTIFESSSYDNMWWTPEATEEADGTWGIVAFDDFVFQGDDRAASLAVSDHRPVWAGFQTGGPDDDPEGAWRAGASLAAASR